MKVWRNYLLLRCSSCKKLHLMQKNAVFLSLMLLFLSFLQKNSSKVFSKKEEELRFLFDFFQKKNYFKMLAS